SQVLAVVVGVVGLVTLSEHVFLWNTGLDQLVFLESTAEAGRSFPGRMGIAASLNFSLLGGVLLLLDAQSRRWFRLANISVLMVIAITLLIFLFYFYGVDPRDPVTLHFTIA